MPASLSPPIDLSKLVAGVADSFSTISRQSRSRQGVYNALGRKIGSFETLADFCAGRWLLFSGEAQPPYAELRVMDWWGNKVPAGAFCLKQRQATTIATPAEVAKQRQKTDAEARGGFPALPQLPAVPTLNQIPYSQLALWGGAGLLTILLLRRRA